MHAEIMHIGFDDTDSPRMGCTTYVAALLIEKLAGMNVQFIDYPNLIRLNPNVPWKTRGNGALCLRILYEDQLYEDLKETVIETVEENSDLEYKGTDPGIVFLKGEIPRDVRDFAKEAIQGIVKLRSALKLIKKFKAEAVGYKTGRGIIGGLAAIGETLNGDHTFELIAYRRRENWGTSRRIDESSVIEMDRKMGNLTFNNVDPETGRILIMPRGPDPVLYGIRGENPEAVKLAHEMIRVYEPIDRWVIFRTNHGTDAHLRVIHSIRDVKPYHPVIVQGRVDGAPRIIPGGHVIFRIKDDTGAIDCAVYEQGGNLRKIASGLIEGDVIKVYGGVRPPLNMNPMTINVEKIEAVSLAEKIILKNPLCPVCGKRMKSMGKGKGFECYKCGFHGANLTKISVKVERDIRPGLYVAPPRSERHLTKPLSRYNLEKRWIGFRVIRPETFWAKCSSVIS
ncbi:MAG: tRNA(Ile)(2)-agmatinylcytidine synthase [Candidatus Bathyarchaeia archaeon]